MSAESLLRAVKKLDTPELLRFHREVCRLVGPIYMTMHRPRYEAGVAASAARQQAGYDKHRKMMQRLGYYTR